MKIKSHKLTIINPHVNYFEATRMIQSKIGAQQDFKHMMQSVYIFTQENY